jgi:predicted MFS family arabinose efflux permease
MPAQRTTGSSVLRLLKRKSIAYGMAACGLFFMGQFALFTYVRPFLETVTLVDFRTLSVILLVIGIAGFVGTTLIGSLLKLSMYGTLVVIPVVMAAIAVSLVFFGEAVVTVSVLLGLWGLVGTAAPVGWWAWLAKVLPTDAEAGGGLMVATIQLCIAAGSALGGALFDASGYRATFVTSAVLLAFAAAMAFMTARSNERVLQ